MLKLSISASILSAISTSAASLMAGIITTEKNNLKLNAILKARNKKMAEAFEIPVEEYVKNKEELRAKSLSNILSKLTLTGIKPINTKIGSITVVEETVEIAINDQYIIDCIESVTRVGIRIFKPLSDISVIFEEESNKTEAMLKTWEEDKEDVPPTESKDPESETEVKTVNASDEPSETVSSILKEEESKDNCIFNGWTLKKSDYITPEPLYTDEKREEWIDLFFLSATNTKGKNLNIGTSVSKQILSSTEDLKETSKKVELPESLILAVYEYYGFAPLASKAE